MSKENKPILKHLRSSSTATDGKHSKLPSLESFPSDAQDKYGIFAINYLKGQETITTLNSDDKVVPFNLNIVVDFSLSPTDQQEIDKTIFEAVKNAKLVTINNVYVVNQKDVKDKTIFLYCNDSKEQNSLTVQITENENVYFLTYSFESLQYVGNNGIIIDDNKISVKLSQNDETQHFLNFNANGELQINGINNINEKLKVFKDSVGLNENGNFETEVESIKDCDNVTSAIETIANKVSSIDGGLSTTNTNLSNLTNTVDNITTNELPKINGDINNLNSQNTNLQGRIDSLENKNTINYAPHTSTPFIFNENGDFDDKTSFLPQLISGFASGEKITITFDYEVANVEFKNEENIESFITLQFNDSYGYLACVEKRINTNEIKTSVKTVTIPEFIYNTTTPITSDVVARIYIRAQNVIFTEDSYVKISNLRINKGENSYEWQPSIYDITDVESTLNTFMLDANLQSNAIDTLKEIQDYINSDGKDAQEMLTNINNIESIASTANQKASQNATNIENLTNSIQKNQDDIVEINKNIGVLESEIENNAEVAATLIAKVKDSVGLNENCNFETEVESIKDCDNVTSAIETIANSVDKNQDDIVEINKNIGVLEEVAATALTKIKQSVGLNENCNFETEVESIKDCDNVTSAIETIANTVSNIDGGLSTTNTNLSNLTNTVTLNKSEIDDKIDEVNIKDRYNYTVNTASEFIYKIYTTDITTLKPIQVIYTPYYCKGLKSGDEITISVEFELENLSFIDSTSKIQLVLNSEYGYGSVIQNNLVQNGSFKSVLNRTLPEYKYNSTEPITEDTECGLYLNITNICWDGNGECGILKLKKLTVNKGNITYPWQTSVLDSTYNLGCNTYINTRPNPLRINKRLTYIEIDDSYTSNTLPLTHYGFKPQIDSLNDYVYLYDTKNTFHIGQETHVIVQNKKSSNLQILLQTASNGVTLPQSTITHLSGSEFVIVPGGTAEINYICADAKGDNSFGTIFTRVVM